MHWYINSGRYIICIPNLDTRIKILKWQNQRMTSSGTHEHTHSLSLNDTLSSMKLALSTLDNLRYYFISCSFLGSWIASIHTFCAIHFLLACLLPCGLLPRYLDFLSFVNTSSLLTCCLPCLHSNNWRGCFLSFILATIVAFWLACLLACMLSYFRCCNITCNSEFKLLIYYLIAFIHFACFLVSLATRILPRWFLA